MGLEEPMIIVYDLVPQLVKCEPIVILNNHLVMMHLICGTNYILWVLEYCTLIILKADSKLICI